MPRSARLFAPPLLARTVFTSLLLALAKTSSAEEITFDAPFRLYSGGVTGSALAVGDLNGDEKADLVQGADGACARVFLGVGDGTLQASYPVCIFAGRGIALVDMNSDGKLDLVGLLTTSVSVVLGNGDGTFGAVSSQPVAFSASGLAVADFDMDSKLDVVVASGSGLVLLMGNGDGTLDPALSLSSTGRFPITGDFDGDTHPDLVSYENDPSHNSDFQHYVRLGNGDGTFGVPLGLSDWTPQAQPVGRGLTHDLDGDGVLDVAFLVPGPPPYESSWLDTRLGNGDGTFAPAVRHPVVAHATANLTVADLDDDGHRDVVLAEAPGATFGGRVTALRGRGDGTLENPRYFAGCYTSLGLVSADMNGDGRDDIATACRNIQSVAVMLANPDGSLGGGGQLAVYPPTNLWQEGPHATVMSDVDGDEDLDLVAMTARDRSSLNTDTLVVLLGNGMGGFSPPIQTPLDRDVYWWQHVVDLDADGFADLITSDTYGPMDTDSTVSVHLGNGDGTFGPRTAWLAGNPPGEIVSADLNGDDHADLIVGNGGTIIVGGVHLHYARAMWVLLGNGDGTLQAPQAYDLGEQLQGIEVGDLDLDQDIDVVVGVGSPDSVVVLLGNGDGTLARTGGLALTPVNALDLGDVDEDGVLDLVVADDDDRTTVHRGLGDGSFAVLHTILELEGLDGLVDLDRDGHLDMAIGGGSGLRAYRGNGDGTFGPGATWFGLGASPGRPVFGDLDGDQRPEVVTGNGFTNSFSILWNTSPKGLAAVGPRVVTPATPGAIALAGAEPNPTRGTSLTVAFSLPGHGAATLDLFDIGGRRVRSREVGSLGLGTHRVDLAAGARLSPGVYLIRLTSAGRTLSRRAVVVGG